MEKEDRVKAKMDQIWNLLTTDPDFICLPRYGGSLKRLLERYPDGVPDHIAAEALNTTVVDYQRVVATAIEKLRTHL